MTQARAFEKTSSEAQELVLTSRAFANGGPIPERHTADGEDAAPPLSWRPPPPGTESLALLCEDLDGPHGPFVHWLLWNIAPSQTQLPEALREASSPRTLQGENGFGRIGWAGPNPRVGKAHRYVFRLYALDTRLGLPGGATRRAFEEALAGHVLAAGSLIGVYARRP